jgi:Abortive infection C-terminus
MNELISPKYFIKLTKSVEESIRAEYANNKDIKFYLNRWIVGNYESNGYYNGYEQKFQIIENNNTIDLPSTLNSMDDPTLLKIAIDLGVDTPDFIPSIPTFKNELKSHYKTAFDTFTKSFNLIETDPSTAIGLANSALESIIKEILKDERIIIENIEKQTTYKLSIAIFKVFNILSEDVPPEFKTIGSQLVSICQTIEKLRSEKTNFHGKTSEDYLIEDSVFTYFVINSVTTIGLFLNSYYKLKFPKQVTQMQIDDLPF